VFTGIVRELARVATAEPSDGGLRLVLEAPATAPATAVGDSIALNGCCLTAVAVEPATIAFDAVPETLARTTLGGSRVGAAVNLEPALRAGEPLGGHYVQGHVDAVGRVRGLADRDGGRRVWIDAPDAVLRYVVEKGSITVDGVSLTVAALDRDGFEVALIPHTLEVTTLGASAPGDGVNLEADVLAKYVERLLAQR
jgi:riboflavin synthase